MNSKRDSIGSISFSDAMCSGVTGLKMDKLFSPVGGLVMSGEHYLKNYNNKKVQELSIWKIINWNYPVMRFLKRNHIKLYLEKVLMESKDNKPKIIIRRLGMNRIQRIQIFLQDYKSLNPHLKNLLNEVQEDFQKELIKEYRKVSRHPYPNEYLSVT